MNGNTWFPVSSGLLTLEHCQSIGPALWVFLWMIHHQYRPKNGEPDSGMVKAGEAIAYAQIGLELGIPSDTCRKHISTLEAYKYIRSEFLAGLGKRYFIANPIRWALGPTKNGQTEQGGPSNSGQGVCPNLDGGLTKNGHPNKEQRTQRTQRTTKNKSSTFDPGEMQFPDGLNLGRESWGEWIEHRQQIGHPLTELAARKSLEKLSAFAKEGYRPPEVIDHCIANGWRSLFTPNGRHTPQPPPGGGGGALDNFRKLRDAAGVKQ